MHKNIYELRIFFLFSLFFFFFTLSLLFHILKLVHKIDNVYKCILTRVSDKQNLNSPKKACKYRN